jgi:hypothetical protein
MKTQVRAARAK